MTSKKSKAFQAALRSYILAYGEWQRAWESRMQDINDEARKARTQNAYQWMLECARILKEEQGFDAMALMFPDADN
jgi:hypothetical protein